MRSASASGRRSGRSRPLGLGRDREHVLDPELLDELAQRRRRQVLVLGERDERGTQVLQRPRPLDEPRPVRRRPALGEVRGVEDDEVDRHAPQPARRPAHREVEEQARAARVALDRVQMLGDRLPQRPLPAGVDDERSRPPCRSGLGKPPPHARRHRLGEPDQPLHRRRPQQRDARPRVPAGVRAARPCRPPGRARPRARPRRSAVRSAPPPPACRRRPPRTSRSGRRATRSGRGTRSRPAPGTPRRRG